MLLITIHYPHPISTQYQPNINISNYGYLSDRLKIRNLCYIIINNETFGTRE